MSREEEAGFDLFGTNLFEAANHDQKWIITAPKRETDVKQIEYNFTGTEFEVKQAAKSIGGTYRRADNAK